MDGGPWQATVHGVTKSQTRLSDFTSLQFTFQRNHRADLLQNGLVGSPCSPRDSQGSSPTPQFQKQQFFGTQFSSQSNSHIHT